MRLKFGWIGALLCLTLAIAGCGGSGHRVETLPEPKDDSYADYVVQPGDDWTRVSEMIFGIGTRAGRIALDAGLQLDTPPAEGMELRVRIRPDEMDGVRRLRAARGAYNEGATLMGEAGKEEAALTAFRDALQTAPDFVDARYNEGLVLLQLGRPEEALDALERVRRLRSTDKDVLYAVASAHFHLGDFEQAEAEAERALEIDPGFLRAQFTLAMALEKMGAEAARSAWERYLVLDPSSAWAAQARQHLGNLP